MTSNKDNIIRNKSGYFTFKEDPQQIKYCSGCLDIFGKTIQCKEDGRLIICPNCGISTIRKQPEPNEPPVDFGLLK